MSTDIATILERAADLIEPEGAWVQGTFHQKYGLRDCYCAAGALIEASHGDRLPEFERAADILVSILPGHPSGRASIVAFNDAPERTQAEVVAKLREAAAKARECA